MKILLWILLGIFLLINWRGIIQTISLCLLLCYLALASLYNELFVEE